MTFGRSARITVAGALALVLPGTAAAETGPAVVAEISIDAAAPVETFKGVWSLDAEAGLYWLEGKASSTEQDYDSKLGFGSTPLSLLTVAAIQGGYRINVANEATVDVIIDPPVMEGVERATAYDTEGRQLAEVTLSGVEDSMFDSNVPDIALLTYLFATNFNQVTEECHPTYEQCKSDAHLACGTNGIDEFLYKCDPKTGAVTCDWDCNDPPAGD